MSLRPPTKMESAGVVVAVFAGWLARMELAHPEGDVWHWAGIGGLLLFGVVLFVGENALRVARGVASIPGYARREWQRRSTKTIAVSDLTLSGKCRQCGHEMAFCVCPEEPAA